MVDKEQGWLSARLEELLIHVIGGDWGKGDDYVDDDLETVSCIRGSEFKNWKTELGATAVTRRIKSSSLATRQLADGDLLIEISGGGPDQPVGRTVLITEQVLGRLPYPAVCTNFLRLARPSNYFNSAFLNHYLVKFYNSGEVVNYQAGSNNLRNLKFKEYSKIEIPIPPLAEQKVIADKLETMLTQVETTKVRLERIPEILKTFRQSVLAAAVSGKLTEGWREENDVSVEQWLPTTVGALAEVATGKTPKRTTIQYWEGGSIPWLTSAATGEAFTNKSEQFVTKQAVIECSLKVFPAGTLLLAMYGEGKTRGQVTEIQLDAACNQACAAILVDETKVSKKFLKIRLQENYEETRKAAVGGAQPNLNLSKVREIPVALPTEPEQFEIVRRVEELFAFADNIEAKNNTALLRVNKITQSTLEKAFRGELTADWRAANPDLFSGDNSAGALLAKIKVDRDSIKKQSNPKRTAVKKKTGSHMSKQIIKVVEALKKAGKPLNGQQLLAASGYPGDSSTDQLEQFFLDIREALGTESIIKLERDEDGQDWFALAERNETKKA